MTKPIKVSLCEDCIVTDAYGAPFQDTGMQHLTKVEGMLLGNDPDCHEGECEGHFDRVCDGCDTPWGGNRYCYIATTKEG